MANLYRLCQILAVLPGSSVDCERGFSNLNRIKGEDRNSLGNDHLTHLIRISSFDISDQELNAVHMGTLVEKWKRDKDRRVNHEKEDIPMNL
jgi:hypothetical protein